MNKEQASLMTEARLWQLYHRLQRAEALQQRLAAGPAGSTPADQDNHLVAPRHATLATAIAAAVTENLIAGDTVGLRAQDWVTRSLLGVPLASIHQAANLPRRAGRKNGAVTWSLAVDAEHGLLPGTGEEQAELAVGVALASRLHATGNLTVLLAHASSSTSRGNASTALPDWTRAMERGVALGLPLLFITDSRGGLQTTAADPRAPSPAMPSIPVDREDAIALYRVIYESAARARAGGGPTWIDCRDAGPLPGSRSRAGKHQPDLSPLELLEQAMRARLLFKREQQRHVQRAIEREFVQAGWAPLPEG